MDNNKWTYSWTQNYSLNPNYQNISFTINLTDWVYTNDSMMQAIEDKLASMEHYPEAEELIQKVLNGSR